MAKIKISDLGPADGDLFSDSENYLHDLTKEEMMDTVGGWWWPRYTYSSYASYLWWW